MKTFKYVAAALTLIAASFAYTSCDKEVDPTDVDAKQNYWIEFTLSNPGSLNAAGQARFAELVDSVIYGEKGAVHYPMYVTESYARTNYEAVIAIPNEESDLVQKIIKPVAQSYNSRDFEATLTLSKDEQQTVLASKVYRASEAN